MIKSFRTFDSIDEGKSILEDIFNDVLDDMKIEVKNVGFNYSIRLVFNRIFDSITLERISRSTSIGDRENIHTRCGELLNNNVYEVLTSRYIRKPDYKRIRARCINYGDFFPLTASPWHNGQYKVDFLRNKDEILRKSMDIIREYIGNDYSFV